MLWGVFFYSVFYTTTAVIKGANILVFMPLPIKSHFRGFQSLFEELSHRGHNVTVASSFPLDRPIVNYTDLGPFVSKERGLSVCERPNNIIYIILCFSINLQQRITITLFLILILNTYNIYFI